MSAETLPDRIAGPPTYLLDDLTVTVIPSSGVVWHEPVDTYAFETDLLADDRLVTAADIRSLYAAPDRLPPSDVRAASFSCCAGCASAPRAQRCTACPRGRPHLHIRTYDKQPRRRSWREARAALTDRVVAIKREIKRVNPQPKKKA